MIEVDHLSKRYLDIQALDDISFTIQQGDVIGLLGPAGSGKSTLLRIIAGILKADTGHARPTNGHWPTMAYKPDSLTFPPHMKVQQYLKLIGRLQNMRRRDRRRAMPLIVDQVELSAVLSTPISKLSNSLRQRLGLAQAMMGDPTLLLLDEPTNDLDHDERAKIHAIIRQLKDAGKTIILSSQQLHDIETVCDHILIISHGRLVLQKNMAEALTTKTEIEIHASHDLSPLATQISAITPDVDIAGDRILLKGDQATHQRSAVLELLLTNQYDIIGLEDKSITLSKLYAEAVQ